jgi:hypothetical protein
MNDDENSDCWFIVRTTCRLPYAATGDVPVLTVCEALKDAQRFEGKSVVVVGRFSSTDEGSWLDEDCGLKVPAAGREFQPSISTSYAASDFDAPPQKPSGFMWDEHLLQQKLKQVKQTTRLRQSDQWRAIFGRLETQLPRKVTIGNGRYGYTTGFGHLSAAPAQLVSPTDGSHAIK